MDTIYAGFLSLSIAATRIPTARNSFYQRDKKSAILPNTKTSEESDSAFYSANEKINSLFRSRGISGIFGSNCAGSVYKTVRCLICNAQ